MSALPDRSVLPIATPTLTSPSDHRPVLQVVSAPEPARSLVPYVMSLVAILVGAMVGALFLNTSMAQTSFEIQSKQIELAQMQRHEASLRGEVETAASPGALQQSATELGMVPAEEVGHVDLASKSVLAEPEQ